MKRILLLLLVLAFCTGTAFAGEAGQRTKQGTGVVLLKSPQYMNKEYYRCLEKLAKSSRSLVFGDNIQAEFDAYRRRVSQPSQEASSAEPMSPDGTQTLPGNMYRMTQDRPGTVVVIPPEVFANLPPEVAAKFSPYSATNPRMTESYRFHEPTIQELLDFAKTSPYEKILYIMASSPITYSFSNTAGGGVRAIVEANAYLCDGEKIVEVCSTAKRDSTQVSMFNMGNAEKSSIKGAFKKCLDAIAKSMSGLI